MLFTKEIDFEEALTKELGQHGWSNKVLMNPTEEDLIENWRTILFENNRGEDHLNNVPLSKGEMDQILLQIREKQNPFMLNTFINGKDIYIKRDNEKDTKNFGKEVGLKIYDRLEIAAGQSRYQIARQPQFTTKSEILGNRRGDILLLINGMPVFHIEVKRSGVPVLQACNQIERYAKAGVYKGIFALVQIFVAMNPEETVYFANPGPDGVFKRDFYFHWADFDNIPINDWKKIVAKFLYIPMAHQMIGFYSVADSGDRTLKVMRSYQCYACNKISDKVALQKGAWDQGQQRGGYIWHTTGSGKTMTSFKSAQLIADSGDADKVIFLMDRIELGVQSLKEFQNFADSAEDVQGTENTGKLIEKILDNESVLIVTSIQKMSKIKEEGKISETTLKRMQAKRIVFIIDECHRSTFGSMLNTIKASFPNALFFGFTGTPIFEENKKKDNTTVNIFGDLLHRYSIADGIRDKNVLGFDPIKVLTFKDSDIRTFVALYKAKAKTVDEALTNEKKNEVYSRYINMSIREVEENLPASQYDTDTHRNMVVTDILENWQRISNNGKFHAILATNSIKEAGLYYRLFKTKNSSLKITALFDPNIDNRGDDFQKEESLEEIITDYNTLFKKNFIIQTYPLMKKDIASRLAHKAPYEYIRNKPEEQIDLLLVVDQMLTGFDSKWINTLYLDKKIENEALIQAFSRTNRIFGPEKPFGTVKYYRYPHTMELLIDKAFKLFADDKPYEIFAEHLDTNIEKINSLYNEIETIFKEADIENMEKLPGDKEACAKFVKKFNELNRTLEAAKIQGFDWKKEEYTFDDEKTITCDLKKDTFSALVARYKELKSKESNTKNPETETPYELEGYITTIETADIDADYMDSRFVKYLKLLEAEGLDSEAVKKAETALHSTFSALSQEEQKIANMLIHDIQSGDFVPTEGKTLRDYITEAQANQADQKLREISENFGVDFNLLKELKSTRLTEKNLNEFGRFDALMKTVQLSLAKKFFEEAEKTKLIPPKVMIRVNKYLRDFLLE